MTRRRDTGPLDIQNKNSHEKHMLENYNVKESHHVIITGLVQVFSLLQAVAGLLPCNIKSAIATRKLAEIVTKHNQHMLEKFVRCFKSLILCSSLERTNT